jgi:hypothetical protein
VLEMKEREAQEAVRDSNSWREGACGVAAFAGDLALPTFIQPSTLVTIILSLCRSYPVHELIEERHG